MRAVELTIQIKRCKNRDKSGREYERLSEQILGYKPKGKRNVGSRKRRCVEHRMV